MVPCCYQRERGPQSVAVGQLSALQLLGGCPESAELALHQVQEMRTLRHLMSSEMVSVR